MSSAVLVTTTFLLFFFFLSSVWRLYDYHLYAERFVWAFKCADAWSFQFDILLRWRKHSLRVMVRNNFSKPSYSGCCYHASACTPHGELNTHEVEVEYGANITDST